MSRTRRFFLFPLTRIVLAIALVAAFSAATRALLHLAHVSPGTITQAAIGSACVALAFAIVGRYVERRTLPELGVRPRRIARDTALGFSLGAAFIVTVIAILFALGGYRASLSADSAGAIGGTLLFFLFVALTEEILFRSVLFRIVEDGLGSWASVVLSAGIFGAVHLANPGASWVAAVAIMIEAGLLLAALYMLTRSLPFVVGVHWAWNFFEGGVFGVEVSGKPMPSILRGASSGPVLLTGGEFGPEAGLVAVAVCGTTAVALLVLAARRGNIMAPSWVRRRAAG